MIQENGDMSSHMIYPIQHILIKCQQAVLGNTMARFQRSQKMFESFVFMNPSLRPLKCPHCIDLTLYRHLVNYHIVLVLDRAEHVVFKSYAFLFYLGGITPMGMYRYMEFEKAYIRILLTPHGAATQGRSPSVCPLQ